MDTLERTRFARTAAKRRRLCVCAELSQALSRRPAESKRAVSSCSSYCTQALMLLMASPVSRPWAKAASKAPKASFMALSSVALSRR